MNALVKPEIEVEIVLTPTNEGGRSSSVLRGEYRGVLGVAVGNFSVRFEVLEDQFAPGQTRRVGVQFLFPSDALPYFPVGTAISVWE